jgi:IS30 family transposase
MARRFSHLTFEERKIIEDSLKNGVSFRGIGYLINRAKGVVSDEVARNGGRANYTAEKAQARREEILARTSKNSGGNRDNRSQHSLWERMKELEKKLTIIESHLEIIIDSLEIKND